MTRDMTRAQFNAALKRRGWRKVLMWIDLGAGKPSIGMVMLNRGRGYKINYRASLAKAIREAEAQS